MGRFWQYFSLSAQACIAAVFFATAISGYIYVLFEIQRYASNLQEDHTTGQQVSIGMLSGCLMIYLTESGFALVPYYLERAGFKSRNVRYIFPVVYQATSIIGWFMGYVPVLNTQGVCQLLLLRMDDINIRIRKKKQDSSPRKEGFVPRNRRTGDDKYVYRRLSGSRSIRIARLAPSSVLNSAIRCEIIETSLDDAPHYTALSYAWDSHEGTVSIICDGCSLQVTVNCARALRRIRELHGRSHHVNVWVDAVCIDQGSGEASLQERSQQIQIMGEVYKSATYVVAWIGDHAAQSEDVCNFLLSVGRAFGKAEDFEAGWTAARAVARKKTHQWIAFSHHFRRFFRRSWFTRLWPVQEVTLPFQGKVSLLCGDLALPLNFIRIGWHVLTDIGFLAGTINLDQSVALQFYISDALALKRNEPLEKHSYGRPLITNLSDFSLTNVMRATRFKACSVGKDKFFALLGVFQELGIVKNNFDVDEQKYANIDTATTFSLVCILCRARDGDLSILGSSRSAERYLSHDDFWSTQLDPYDTSGNMVLGIGPRLKPLFSGGVADPIPKWRKRLPTFVPDWTQWATNDLHKSDIALVKSYSTRHMWFAKSSEHSRNMNFSSTTPFITQVRPKLINLRQTAQAKGLTTLPQRGHQLLVQVKVIGVVRGMGTVDSFALLWELLGASMNFYQYRQSWADVTDGKTSKSLPYFKPIPEASLAALIETIRNFLLNSLVAQTVLSLRSIHQEMDAGNVVKYCVSTAMAVGLQQPLVHALDSALQAPYLGQRQSTWVFRAIYLFSGIFALNGMASGRFYRWLSVPPSIHQFVKGSSSFLVLVISLTVWSFRKHIYTAMYGDEIAASTDWFYLSLQIGFFMQAAGYLAALMEDAILVLFFRIVTAVNIIFMVAGTFLYTRVAYLTLAATSIIPVLASVCIVGTLKEVMGTTLFKPADALTSGLTFFGTETWVTGNTAAPVRLFDVVAIIDGATKPMVLRRKGTAMLFEVVGAAYVGNRTREEMVDSGEEWKTAMLL